MGYAASVPGAEPLESVSEEHQSRLTREQVVERIMSMNVTATAEYLGRFGEDDLREYLRHLVSRSQGNMARAARDAGIDRKYLYMLLKKYGLAPGEIPSGE